MLGCCCFVFFERLGISMFANPFNSQHSFHLSQFIFLIFFAHIGTLKSAETEQLCTVRTVCVYSKKQNSTSLTHQKKQTKTLYIILILWFVKVFPLYTVQQSLILNIITLHESFWQSLSAGSWREWTKPQCLQSVES